MHCTLGWTYQFTSFYVVKNCKMSFPCSGTRLLIGWVCEVCFSLVSFLSVCHRQPILSLIAMIDCFIIMVWHPTTIPPSWGEHQQNAWVSLIDPQIFGAGYLGDLTKFWQLAFVRSAYFYNRALCWREAASSFTLWHSVTRNCDTERSGSSEVIKDCSLWTRYKLWASFIARGVAELICPGNYMICQITLDSKDW